MKMDKCEQGLTCFPSVTYMYMQKVESDWSDHNQHTATKNIFGIQG